MLGWSDGLLDGSDEGLALGNGEGAGDGGLVGAALGLLDTVGEPVGDFDGVAVGAAVGGSLVHASQARGHSSLTNAPYSVLPHHIATRVAVLPAFAVSHAHFLSVIAPLYSYCPKMNVVESVHARAAGSTATANMRVCLEMNIVAKIVCCFGCCF